MNILNNSKIQKFFIEYSKELKSAFTQSILLGIMNISI